MLRRVSTRHAPTARSIAADTWVRVFKDGAFAAAVLDAAFARHVGLDPRDRALATELAYGALRTGPFVERRLAELAPRGLGKLDETVRAHLVVAGYQLLFLDRVPAFAAVSEAVERIREARGGKLAAFANAILRRLSERAAAGPRVSIERAASESAAPWLREALARVLGDAGAEAFLSAGPVPPPIGLRLRVGADREAFVTKLRASAPQASIEPGRASPLVVLVRGAGDPRKLPGYDEGAFVVQEEGSVVVASSLGARPGERVLDACAGRGNKSSLLAELVGPAGAVDAADLHPSKLERLAGELRRSNLAPRETHAVDWTVGAGDVPDGYDRVLVDAPCSGTGTLRRRPDLATRRAACDLAALAERQVRIVANAAGRVRSGGTLVYAVCSVLAEEAERVVERVLAERRDLEPTPIPDAAVRALAAGRAESDVTALRLLPHVHGTDGYFVAAFARR